MLEAGDIFFFRRARIDVPEQVAQLYLVLARDERFRVFSIGRRRLPEHRADRRWAVNLLGLATLADVQRELAAKQYTTATRGQRHVPAAVLEGAGRYVLRPAEKQTELVYSLSDGRDARDVIAVRNPRLSPRGARYPPELLARFGGHRWLSVEAPELLDPEGAEVLLIGTSGAQPLAQRVPVRALEVPAQAVTLPPPPRGRPVAQGSAAALARMLKGVTFPRQTHELIAYAEEQPAANDVGIGQLCELPERSFKNMAEVEGALGEVRNRGAPFVCPYCDEVFDEHTRYERHLVAAHPPQAPSAADLELAVKGVKYPRSRDELVRYAEEIAHAKREIVELLRALPERPYRNAADLAVAFGELKRGQAPNR